MDDLGWRSRVASALPPRRRPADNPAHPQQDGQAKADAIDGADNDLLDNDLKILPLLNDELNRRLDQQWETISQLDTKAAGLVTFAVAAMGLLVSHPMNVIGYFALVAYGVGLACTFACLAVRQWTTAPAPALLVELEHADPALSYDRLIRAKAKSYVKSQGELSRKADWLKIATWSMLVPAILTVARFLN